MTEDGDPGTKKATCYERTKNGYAVAAGIGLHPHVITPLEQFEKSSKKGVRKFVVVMDLVKGGDLLEYLNEYGLQDDRFAVFQRQSRRQALQLLEALKVTHEGGVIHSDVKPENVLVDEDGNLHLSDWGLSLQARVSATPLSSRRTLGQIFWSALNPPSSTAHTASSSI